jgi:hypothetical protein
MSKRHFGVLPDDPRPNYFGSDVALDGQLVVAAGPDPPIMGNDGITGYRQGWVDLFRPNASPEVASFDSAGLEDRLFALDLQVSDPDGDSIVSEIVRPPEHGEVTGSGVNLNYRGQTDFHGSDQARIAFLDPYGGRTEVGVDITVDPVNDAPKGSGVRVEVQAGEETPVALDAVDPEGDPIRVIIVNKPAHGVIEGESPPLRYTSDPTYHGYDFVKFRLTDGVDESIVYELEIEVVGEDQTDPSDDGAPDDEPEAERRGASGGGCTSTDVPHGWAPFLMFLPGLILHRTRRT